MRVAIVPLLDGDAFRNSGDIAVPGDGPPSSRWSAGRLVPPVARLPRVGLITPSLYPGGGERWMLQLMRATKEAIHWAGVACVHREWVRPEIVREFRCLAPVVGYDPSSARRLFDADCLIAWGVTELPRILNGYHGKVVLVSHGCSDRWTREVIRHSMTAATHFVAVSEAARRPFAGLVDLDRVTSLHNGIDATRCHATLSRAAVRSRLGYTDADRVVGAIGRLGPEKHPEAIVEAVALLPPHVKLLMVGDGAIQRAITRLAAQKIPGRAQFLPATSKIGDLLAAFDCFILTSPSEGFCLAVCEALYAGVPVVSTPVGVLPEIEAKHGPCWEPIPIQADRATVAEAIERVVTASPKTLSERAKRGRAAIEEAYTLEHFGHRWTRFLLSVVSTPTVATRSSSRPRVGFLTPTLTYGGADRWVAALATGLDRARFAVSGVAVRDAGAISKANRDKVSRWCPILEGAESLRTLAATSDILIAWGLRDLSALAEFPGRVVFVGHGDCPWTRVAVAACLPQITDWAAVSHSAAQSFPDPARVTIVHNGIDTDRCWPVRSRDEVRAEWGVRPDEIALGYAGRFSPEKNPFAPVHAARQLGKPYRAVLVGDSWDREVQVADARRILSDVVIRPPVENVGDIYHALDCFVSVSQSEGFALGLAEAWYCGCPTVSTPVGATELDEMHGRLAVRVAVGAEPAEVAAAVQEAISPENRPTVTRAAETVAAHYTAEAMCKRWDQYLESIATAR